MKTEKVQNCSSSTGVATTRREFLKTSTGLALGVLTPVVSLTAAQRARSIGANERIRIGQIGCGNRGIEAHMAGVYQHAKEANIEITAVCDPWRVARERANAKVKEWFGRDAKQFDSYQDLLAYKEIDAVMIASPDHLHTKHLEAAARAGKHIYVEKPMARELPDLLRAYDAVKAAGVIVQVGTQLRSLPEMAGARELFKTGIFGKVSRIEECRNSERPYWYRYLKEVREEDVNWKEFLGDLPMRPFRADLYSGWYGYYEFSKGPIPGLGSHFIDLVHFITGAKFPEACVCLGGIFTSWRDEHKFTVPDCIQALWTYPEGFLVSSSNNCGNGYGNSRKLFGDQGVLDFENWAAPFYHSKGAPKRDSGKIMGENKVKPIERPDHFLDWLQCMRTGRQPHAPIEAGYQHSIAVIMAMTSYETGRKTIYDHASRTIKLA